MIPQDSRAPAPPGQMVDVGGFRLHAVMCGRESPTVVLEPGLGGCTVQYARIQSAVSAFARVLAYDRAGQGWSDRSPQARTPANLIGELRTLLGRLELQPPYVLVGHSFGGLLSLIHAGLYPAETAGLVLIDSSDVEQFDSFPNMEQAVSPMARGVRLMKFAGRLGLGKPLTRMSLGSAARSFPPDDLEAFLAAASRPAHLETALAEFSQHRFYFGPHSEVPRSLGDMPLIVVTAGNSVGGRAKFGKMTADELNVHHQEWQKNLARLSTCGEHVVVPGAAHMTILMQPEYAAQAVAAIRRVVELARQRIAYSSS